MCIVRQALAKTVTRCWIIVQNVTIIMLTNVHTHNIQAKVADSADCWLLELLFVDARVHISGC